MSSNPFDMQGPVAKPSTSTASANPFNTPTATTQKAAPSPVFAPDKGVQPLTNVFGAQQASTPAAPTFNPFDATPTGVIANTVAGLPHALIDTATKFRQGTLSSLESAGQTLIGQDHFDIPAPGTPGHNLFTYLYGDQPVENLQNRIAKEELSIQQNPTAKKHGLDKLALPLAFGSIMGDTALNLTPFGGEAKVSGNLLKETTEAGARKILSDIGASPELAKAFAPKFAVANTPEEVSSTLDLLKRVQGTQKLSDRLAARDDWEKGGGQQKFFQLHDEAQALRDRLETARGPEAVTANKRYDTVLERMVKVKEDWLNKWGIDPNDQQVQKQLFERPVTIDRPATPAATVETAKPQIDTPPAGSVEPQSPQSPLPPSIGELISKRSPSIQEQEAAIQEGQRRQFESLPVADEAQNALQRSIQENANNVKNKVNLLDYVKTPEYVLEKVGMAKEAHAVRDAYEGYIKELPSQIDKITGWHEAVKNIPGASQNIFRYLDGVPGVKLSRAEKNVAEEMQAYLRTWADRLKLPQDKRIASYITHIFDEDFIQKEFDPELAKIIDEKTPASVYDPFLQKRLGTKGYKEDAFAALDAYTKRAVRKVHMDPALAGLERAADRAPLETYKYVQRYASRINMRPTETENLLDNLIKSTKIGYKFGSRPVANLSRAARRLVYRGTLGLNIGSAVRNLTQGVNTYAKLGEKYTIIGYSKFLSKATTRDLSELYDSGVLNEDVVQDRSLGVYKKSIERFDKGLFAFFEMAEKINRGSAYFGAKAKALAAGKNEAQAIDYAKRMVRETQFSFSAIDTPVALNDDVVKLLSQMQSYNVKQMEFLGRMVTQKEWAGIARFIGGSFAMVYTLGSLLGMKPQDLIPSVRLGGAPIPSFIGAGFDAVTARTQTDKDNAIKKIKSGLTSLVPAGVQIRKTLQGAGVVAQGGSTTATGRTRYEIPNNVPTKLRALLFGPNTLPQAQNYYNSFNKGGGSPSGGNPFDQ